MLANSFEIRLFVGPCPRSFHLSYKAISSTRATYSYVLCGWHIRSDIALTGVPTSERAGETDVFIQIAPGDSPVGKNAGRFIEHSVERSLINITNVADFEITEGRQIRVWPMAAARQKDIEIFLFGPAWATLCHQRGMLPLHASAIVSRGGITAFAGHSGSGKSTIAALLNSLGYELLADDILPVSFDQNLIPGAWPYLRRLKLHRDPIVQLALTPAEMVGDTLDEKYFVFPKRTANDKWRVLKRLYLLEKNVTDSHLTMEKITGADAVRALIDQTYHFNYILGTRLLGHHLAFCARLASKILVYRLRWPPVCGEEKKRASIICTHLESGSQS